MMAPSNDTHADAATAPWAGQAPAREPTGPGPLARALRRRGLWIVLASLLAGAAAFGIASMLKPVFTARTVIVPPQSQKGAGSSALAMLGSTLGNLGGLAAGAPTPADQYVALLESRTIMDRLVDRFQLQTVYGSSHRSLARLELAEATRVQASKKSGLIEIQVDDHDPKRAADIANRYVDELREMNNRLALTEAQQRRVFFETQMKEARDGLLKAQRALEGSGVNESLLRADPRGASQAMVQLQAEITAAEVKLRGLRTRFQSTTPEVAQQEALLSALRAQLARSQRADSPSGPVNDGYLARYREYKYQEALFDIYARQFELARADESRDGALIQVVDLATPPELKSRPKRAAWAAAGFGVALVLLTLLATWREARRGAAAAAG